MSPDLALQQALIAALRAAPAVSALLGQRIHDEPPEEPEYPHACLTRAETRPWGGLGAEGTEHALTLVVASQFGGTEEAKACIAALRAAIDAAVLTLDGWRVVNLRTTYADVFRAADWRQTLGVLRVRAVTEPL